MKKKKLTLATKRAIVGLLFISPWLIGFLMFYVRSIFMTIQFSLSNIIVGEGTGYITQFIGFDNFKYAFTVHGSFKKILVESIGNMLLNVPLIIFFSLFMALLLNKKFKGRTLVRAIFFLPVIMNSEAIWVAIQHAREVMVGGVSAVSAEMAESSTVNIEYYLYLFDSFGMPEFLLDYVILSVSRISYVITASGVQIVIFIAALQSISPSLYEVAKIEGATAYEIFWKVTLPMVSPLIITNVVYTVVDAFITSDVVQLSYDTAMTNMNYGLSSAFSIISTLCVCTILIVSCGLISKRTFYHN
ncbi:carbohydrate ABC transporter permease [Clostridium sp. Marseille-P299]|uniref:carbohydrate ABC transporter permease n=1 Tax=Clostridium sp. Marseille-P299 TaxID=1805477 RepID=UPI000836FBF6|nr:sugar ABC transporter permease [Clostridium sp. Marseille-P299]